LNVFFRISTLRTISLLAAINLSFIGAGQVQAAKHNTSPTSGASCPKVGSKKSINEKVFTCLKKGNKNVWILLHDKTKPGSKTEDLSLQNCEVPLERKLTYICWHDQKNQIPGD
jgi:hypothetical protein